jgi:hypothetical protein
VYTPIATVFTPVWFKGYTDTANFGASSVATPLLVTTGFYRIQFRGYATD